MKRPRLVAAVTVLIVIVAALGTYFFAWSRPRCIQGSPHCVWRGMVYAWIDENENGQIDEGEPPLPNVHLFAEDTRDVNYFVIAWDNITDSKGEAALWIELSSCSDVGVEMYPVLPNGYRLTTAARVPISLEEQGQSFYFGFARQAGVPTATPRPSEPITVLASQIVCTVTERAKPSI